MRLAKIYDILPDGGLVKVIESIDFGTICSHFPERVYDWPEAGGKYATCAKCGTDYQIKKIEGVTHEGIQAYWAGG